MKANIRVSIALLSAIAAFAACSSADKKEQKEVQDVFTSDSNYFDYEYYGEQPSQLTTFTTPYDYYYYEEPDYFYDEPIGPVILEETPTRPADSWFFEDY